MAKKKGKGGEEGVGCAGRRLGRPGALSLGRAAEPLHRRELIPRPPVAAGAGCPQGQKKVTTQCAARRTAAGGVVKLHRRWWFVLVLPVHLAGPPRGPHHQGILKKLVEHARCGPHTNNLQDTEGPPNVITPEFLESGHQRCQAIIATNFLASFPGLPRVPREIVKESRLWREKPKQIVEVLQGGGCSVLGRGNVTELLHVATVSKNLAAGPWGWAPAGAPRRAGTGPALQAKAPPFDGIDQKKTPMAGKRGGTGGGGPCNRLCRVRLNGGLTSPSHRPWGNLER